MRTIRKGHAPKPSQFPWIGKYLCASCDSLFELTKADANKVKRWADDQRDGISVTIDCPVCKEERSLMQWEKTTDYARYDAGRRADVIP